MKGEPIVTVSLRLLIFEDVSNPLSYSNSLFIKFDRGLGHGDNYQTEGVSKGRNFLAHAFEKSSRAFSAQGNNEAAWISALRTVITAYEKSANSIETAYQHAWCSFKTPFKR